MSLTAERLDDQIAWSRETFGPAPRVEGLLKHIASELDEIRADPADLKEWIDLMILAVDGAQRNCGATGEDIIAAYLAKADENERRQWPDWRTMREDQPIEHDRNGHD